MSGSESKYVNVDGNAASHEYADAACMSAPKVSVIIPLYYAEEYIDDLLSQLREQSPKEIEVICVVDGSPDGTLEIVKRHAKADARIQWLYQENAGAGAARNVGLERARGEYLAFLDADDLYDPLFLEKMYEAATTHDADLVVCQYNHVDYRTGAKAKNQGFRSDCVPVNRAFAPEDLQSPLSDLSPEPMNKLFRKKLVEQEHLWFSETYVSNDLFFVRASIAASKKIVALPDCLIIVRRYVNLESISSNRARNTEAALLNMQTLFTWLSQRGLEERYKASYIDAWAASFRYNASYERNEQFIELAAKTLASEKPWIEMTDKELWQAARLDTGILGIKRLIINLKPQSEVSAIELQRIDNEQTAIAEIIYLLNTKYGKQLPEKPIIFSSTVAYLKSKGLRHSIATFARRIRKT